MKCIRICIVFFIFCAVVQTGASTEKISIPHTGLGKSFQAYLVLPDTYSKARKRFPAIYLLHGYSSNHTSFSRIVKLQEYADSFDVILVCPDGNYNSWYLDSPIRKKSRFAAYIVHDVIGYIDKHYRTIASAEGRAIIGTSMGGHGALTLLSQYPDLFCGGGSISGILDLTRFPGEWDLAAILGSYKSHQDTWKKHSFHHTMKNLSGKNKVIIIDCGTGDFALTVNRAAHQKMETLGIRHEYRESAGGHDYLFVGKVLPYYIGSFARRMHTGQTSGKTVK